MSPEKNCTEKQPQMVLHPSSLCHKPNFTALLSPPHPAHPRGPSYSSGSLMVRVLPLVRLVDQSRQVDDSLSAQVCLQIRYSLTDAQSTPAPHTACLNLLTFIPSGPIIAILPLLPAIALATSLYFFFPAHLNVGTSYQCYLLGENHGRAL